MKTIESNLQQACVTWFRLQYPQHRMRLFAIPNGGQRSLKAGSKAKAEGMLAGVWDLFLAVPYGSYDRGTPPSGLFIEMKTPKGKLTETQSLFKTELETDYDFKVCRSFEEFQQAIREYLAEK